MLTFTTPQSEPLGLSRKTKKILGSNLQETNKSINASEEGSLKQKSNFHQVLLCFLQHDTE